MPYSSVWTRRIGALAVGLGLAMSAVIVPCWWSIARYHNPTCTIYKPDFVSFYTGAKLIWTDKSSLYDLDKQRSIQYPIDPSRGDWVLPYFYPPFFAVALVPLAWLSFSAAFVTMTLINITLLVLALKILISTLALNAQQVKWLGLTTFCNYGVHYALLEGQTSFIALLLLVLFVSAFNTPASKKSGIWAGLMAFKPQLALVPVILLIARRRWSALGLVMVVLGLLGLISLSVIGFEGVRQYLLASRQAISAESYFPHMRPEQPERMHNLRALAYYFFAAPWRDYVWWISTLLALAGAALNEWVPEADDRSSPRRWVITLCILILATPHLHDHDVTLLIVPTAFALKWTGDVISGSVALVLSVLGVLPLINAIGYPHLPPLLPIALLLFLAVDYWCERGRSASLRMA